MGETQWWLVAGEKKTKCMAYSLKLLPFPINLRSASRDRLDFPNGERFVVFLFLYVTVKGFCLTISRALTGGGVC